MSDKKEGKILLRLGEDLRKKLKIYCVINNIAMNEYVKALIIKGLNNKENKND